MDTNEQLITLLARGEICVIPTDTVYGIVGKLNSPAAIAKIYQVKQRDSTKPVGTILAASIAQVASLTTPAALRTAASYWPGPTSVILPASDVYDYAHRGAMSLAVRIPNDQALRSLLVKTGPLASSSANLQSKPPATTIDEAEAYFGNTIPLYVEGGDLSNRKPSRIVQVDESGAVYTVREG